MMMDNDKAPQRQPPLSTVELATTGRYLRNTKEQLIAELQRVLPKYSFIVGRPTIHHDPDLFVPKQARGQIIGIAPS